MSARRTGPADAPLLAWGQMLRIRKAQRRRRVRRVLVGVIGLCVVLGSAAMPPTPRLVWNASASAPIGLYLVSPGAPIRPGDLVIARLPEQVRHLAATRQYLPINVPLVKRVAGSAGDDVCAVQERIAVNGRPVAQHRRADPAGRPMPFWTGCIRLRGDQLFLLMDTPLSFDGRYFGITQGRDVIGKATLLWAR